MRDLLNRKLKEEHGKTLKKTGAPLEGPRTYYMDESELTYDPRTMAVGTHAQEVKAQRTVAHMLT